MIHWLKTKLVWVPNLSRNPWHGCSGPVCVVIMYLKFSSFRSIGSKWRHLGRSHFKFSRVWIISWSISTNWLSGCFILTNDLEWWRKSGITWTIWSHTGYTCFRDWSRRMNTSRSEIFSGCCDQRRSRNWRRVEQIRSLKLEFNRLSCVPEFSGHACLQKLQTLFLVRVEK